MARTIDNLVFENIEGGSFYYDVDYYYNGYDLSLNLNTNVYPITAVPSFNIDPEGSPLIALILQVANDFEVVIYQINREGRFVQLLPGFDNARLMSIEILSVPDENGGRHISGPLIFLNSDSRIFRLPDDVMTEIYRIEEGQGNIVDLNLVRNRLEAHVPADLSSLRWDLRAPSRSAPPSATVLPINTLSLHLAQLYGIPHNVPSPNLTDLAELRNVSISRFEFDPLLQPWAGPPGTSNKIVTLHDTNGQQYFVKVRYDPGTHQIFPPV